MVHIHVMLQLMVGTSVANRKTRGDSTSSSLWEEAQQCFGWPLWFGQSGLQSEDFRTDGSVSSSRLPKRFCDICVVGQQRLRSACFHSFSFPEALATAEETAGIAQHASTQEQCSATHALARFAKHFEALAQRTAQLRIKYL